MNDVILNVWAGAVLGGATLFWAYVLTRNLKAHWYTGRCWPGLHSFPRYVRAETQAPAPVRCTRCGQKYGRKR